MTELISPISKESLDIDSIKTAIKNDLIQNNVITDINYEGSNISVLVQIMAYMVYNVNATQALNANQTMLLLSNIRQNIIYLAQQMGYNITRPISSKMPITLSIDFLEDGEKVNISEGTIFVCDAYRFILNENLTFTKNNLNISTNLIQGDIVDYTIDPLLRFNPDITTDRFLINYTDIENDNLFIRVKGASDINFSEYYTKVSSLLKLTNDKTLYYEDLDAETEFVSVYTFFAGQGRILQPSDTIDVSFLQTAGSNANNIINCEFSKTNQFLSNQNNVKIVNITVNEPSSGGTDVESNDSVKQSAPLFYNSGNRTINKDDYNSFLEKNSLIEKANSWGGESEIPLNLGHVYLCLKPQLDRLYLTATEKYNVLQYLADTHTLAIGLILIQPKYFLIDYTVRVLGDVVLIDNKKQQIENILTKYFNNNYYTFNTFYFSNKINKQIENILDDNASVKVTSEMKLRLSKEHLDELNSELKYYIPNSNKRYYLEKAGIRVDMPDSDQDLYSYFLDGWNRVLDYDYHLNISFSGSVNDKEITEGIIEPIIIDTISYNKKDILLDNVVIGYFNIDLNMLVITENILSDLETDQFININYDDEINIEFIKSSVLTLGDIYFE